jgi:hypothetical protein
MARLRKSSTKAPARASSSGGAAKKQRLSKRIVVRPDTESEDELQQQEEELHQQEESELGRDIDDAPPEDFDPDEAEEMDEFAESLRGEALEACEIVEIKSFLKIWMFIVETMAEDSKALVADTLEWLNNEGATASAREIRNKWRDCHAVAREGTKIRKSKWARLLQDTNRRYQVNPRRLLTEIGLRAEKSLGFSPLGREHRTPQVEDDEEEDVEQPSSPLARRTRQSKAQRGGRGSRGGKS